MSQLSDEDIRLVEHLANANRELSKNDFIFHIKAKLLNYVNFIIITDPTTRTPICSSNLTALTLSVTTIGMKRYIYIFLLLTWYIVQVFCVLQKKFTFTSSLRSGRPGKFSTRMVTDEYRSRSLGHSIDYLEWTVKYSSKAMTKSFNERLLRR